MLLRAALSGADFYLTEAAVLSSGAVTVVLMDLDHFKAVNDAHGHLVGDEVLLGTAGALVGLTRGADVVGRFGGDEFAVVLADTGREAAARIAERFRAALAGLPLSVSEVRLTASIGIAAYPPWPEHPSIDALIAEADEAL
jgi:diguanylate cyclase